MANILRIATKNSECDLHFRDEGDITRLVHFVMRGNNDYKPILNGAGVFFNNGSPKSIADEMLNCQLFFRKAFGIRIRHEIAFIGREELNAGKELEEISRIAYGFAQYYIYSGFQVAYGVFPSLSGYEIHYAINTVCYVDGRKFITNNHYVLDDEEWCLESVICNVTGRADMKPYNWEALEYS